MKFKKMALRGYGFQWWTCDEGSFAARGIFGQGIFIDLARKLVIASNANWGNNATDPTATAAREAFYVAVQQAVDAEVAAAVAIFVTNRFTPPLVEITPTRLLYCK